MPPKRVNAVNTVVSDLIRAAAGASAKNIADEDVDKYVADIILKEAEEKRKKFNDIGVSAYQAYNDKPKPKPNTRFLLNMVKATDNHNQAVIKANEANVAKLRRERIDSERRERRGTDRRDDYRRERRGSDYERSERPHKSERRDYEKDERRENDRKRKNDEEYESDRKTRHKSDHKHSSHKHSSHKHACEVKRGDRSRSSSPLKEKKKIQYKGRGRVKINVSMDKYFKKDYDPTLDIESDDDMYVFGKEEDKPKKKKKKKSKKSKKAKKTKESESSSESSSDSSNEASFIRAWDIGKMD